MIKKLTKYRKDLARLLDSYVVNGKQRMAVEKLHMDLAKKYFYYDKDIERLHSLVESILPLVNNINETEDNQDLRHDLGDLIFNIESILDLFFGGEE